MRQCREGTDDQMTPRFKACTIFANTSWFDFEVSHRFSRNNPFRPIRLTNGTRVTNDTLLAGSFHLASINFYVESNFVSIFFPFVAPKKLFLL